MASGTVGAALVPAAGAVGTATGAPAVGAVARGVLWLVVQWGQLLFLLLVRWALRTGTWMVG